MSERLFLRLEDDPSHGPESGTPAGSVRGVPVHPALRGAVAHLLVYREHIPAGTEVVERVVPDGAVRLAFNLGAAPVDSAPAAAIGASARPALVRLRGAMAGVSVTLRPGAAAALLGVPAGELAEASVGLDTLWGGAGAELLARMEEAPSEAAALALLQDALRARLQRPRADVHAGVAHAARLLTASGGRRSVRDVAAAVGVGERRLQQLFHTHAGLGPRTLGRLARLHACLRLLRKRPAPAWAELALEAGFCDQAHLANEFRALCGLTPTGFLAQAASGSSKTPARPTP